MARTQPSGRQILDGSVQRADLDTTTVGSAVITKIIKGSGLTLTSTGGDSGTGDVTLGVDNTVVAFLNSSPTFTTTTSNHLVGTGNTPSTALSTGAGTSPGIPTVTGNDFAGTIKVTTGTSPATNAVIITITYKTAFTTNSFPIIYPNNAAAGNLAWHPAAAGTATNFTISSGSTALAASTIYIWNYHIIGL